MAKLHVPPPDGVDDRSDVNLAILFAVGCLGLAFYGFTMQEPPSEGGGGVSVEEVGPEEALQRELKAQRKRSEQLGEFSEADLQKMQWSDEDRTVVFRFGPRAAAEIVCEQMLDDIKAGALDKQMRLELEKTLDRRTEFAPWTCMTRVYLAEELPDGDLRDEMNEFWGELEAHEGNPRLAISVLEDFRETRDRPDSQKFRSWLRMCALDFDYQTGTECRRLLYQISPQQGGDLLVMIEKHWQEAGQRPGDMPTIVAALGHLARNGQPPNWRVKETEELPDYDVDFRQATVGYLCRMVNTPTPTERDGVESAWDEVPSLAAEELRRVGRRGARAYEDRLLFRWRETCRLAFGGQGGYQDDQEYVPVPMLAVWNGRVESDPIYRIGDVSERGYCEQKDGYPRWFCLADAWTDEDRPLDQSVAHFFIETRYMEFDDSFEPAKPVIGEVVDEGGETEKASRDAPQAKVPDEPEPAPKARPEAKPEPKPRPKPEARPEPKPEAEPEARPEPKPEAEPEPQSEKPQPKPKDESADESAEEGASD